MLLINMQIKNTEIVTRLAKDWLGAGVEKGDMLLVHSSTARTLRRIKKMGGDPDPSLIIESLLNALGIDGTLIFPLFNFDFTKGIPFDIRNSPSQMGIMTEAGRQWPGAIRTGHPIYSFAVIGRYAYLFEDIKNYSGYGEDSPFGILHRNKGKIAVLDLPDQHSMTFYHYIEESLDVSYRYHKEFTGKYIDSDGTESTRKFGLFVRDIEKGVNTHVNPMGELLWEKNIYKGFRPKDGCGLRTVQCQQIFSEVASVLQEDKAEGLLYAIK